MSKKFLLLAAALAAAPCAALAGETATAANAPAAVAIRNFQFVPATLTVAAGTTVIWTNDDTDVHSVTDRGRVFRSGALDSKETFSYTFTKPGEFTYFCTFHPMMVGTIIVKPAGSSS
ncbi:MAG TPA: cupredoxin domain-containing protein [Stellaceae bacterium]|nr:cupredoxin domain-containing protein [Stellaceae bacterium]